MVMVGNEGREELEMATGSAEQQRLQRTVKLEDLSQQECGASVPLPPQLKGGCCLGHITVFRDGK